MTASDFLEIKEYLKKALRLAVEDVRNLDDAIEVLEQIYFG